MARTVSLTPEHGPHLTLDDLTEFVAEARGKGLPGAQTVRFMGAIEFDMTNGPRAVRITAVPGEISEAAVRA